MKKRKIFFSVLIFNLSLFLLYACSSSSGSSSSPDNNYESQIIDMISVPEGTFEMGWDYSSGYTYQEPVHAVTLSAFLMGKYEITNAEIVTVFNWAKENNKFNIVNASTVTNQGDSQELLDLDKTNHHVIFNESNEIFSVTTGLGDDGSGGSVDLSNYPIFCITWYGAAAFCNYLSEREGLTPCYNLTDWTCNFDADGYRLPTEAEWEYAARYINGTNFTDGNWFSSGSVGDNADILSWNSNNSDETPHCNIYTSVMGSHEVGTKKPNYLGIYDMTGNVYEWCHDWSDYYGADPVTDPSGPVTGSLRISRGGSMSSSPSLYESGLENSIRTNADPGTSDVLTGFRIVKKSN